MGKVYICEIWAFEVMDERDQNYDGYFGRETEPPAGLECHVYSSVSSKLFPPHYPVKFLDAMKFGPKNRVRMVANSEEADYTDFTVGMSLVLDEDGRKIGYGSITEVLDN